MGRSAGTVTIRFEAGTAGFVADVGKAKAAVRDFGTKTHSDMLANTAALRVMEGNLAGGTRAVARFMSVTLGLGPVLTAAFNVVGPILLGAAIVRTGETAAKFFKDMREAPERIATAFREMNMPLKLSNEELAVSNARLENEIAKLEGKRQNTLALALIEAQAAADKLAESLDKDIAGTEKLLKEHDVTFMQGIFGHAGTADLQKQVEEFRNRVAGVAKLQGPGIDRSAVISGLYAEEIARMQSEMAKAVAAQEVRKAGRTESNAWAYGGGPNAVPADQTQRIEALSGALEQLAREQARIPLEAAHADLTGQKEGLEASAATRKADQEELLRLLKEYREAQAGELTDLQKINAEEQESLMALRQKKDLSQAAKDTGAALIGLTFDQKRVNADIDSIKQYFAAMRQFQEEWRKWNGEALKGEQTQYKDNEQIKEGTKILDKYGESLAKTLDELRKLTKEEDALKAEQRSRMISLAPGAGADPVGTLRRQQAPERATIMAQYAAAIDAANQELALAKQKGNLYSITTAQFEKQRIEKEKQLAIDRLDFELATKIAESKKRGIRDFFREMQGQAQTAGNILYDAMNSALDRVSDQLAKLFTGQKTSFGKMLEGIGEEMTRSAIKSGLQRGLGALGSKLGIHPPKEDNWATNPHHVIVDNAQGKGGNGIPEPPIPGMASSAAGSGLAGLLQKIFGIGGGAAAGATGAGTSGAIEAVSSSVSYMAGGGPVSADSAYIVGDQGPELLQRTSGYITNNAELRRTFGGGGGHTFNTTVDARGAEIGVEHRVRRMVDLAHQSAVAMAVRAGHERSMRTPQRA